MTLAYAQLYIKELAQNWGVKLYESDGIVIFPIHVLLNDKREKIENAYAYYLISDEVNSKIPKYGVSIFIDANMSTGAFSRIFGVALSNFRMELKKLEIEANKNG